MDSHKDNLLIIDTLRRLNRIFVKTRNVKDLLSELGDTLLSVGYFSSVWFAVLDRNKRVIGFSSKGLGEYGDKLEKLLTEEGLNYCSEMAIDKDKAVFIAKDPEKCKNCTLLKAEYPSITLNIPIKFQSDLLGVVGITVKETHELTELDLTLLNEFCEDLGNAINTIQLEEGRERLAGAIERLSTSITGNSSIEVMESFLHHLLKSLNGDYAFIGKLVPGYQDRIRTIIVCSKQGKTENFEYTLKGTPCHEAVFKDICCYTANVAEAFPEDNLLKDMGIDAYIGTPLLNTMNQVIGIMVVMKKRPFKSGTLARYIFQTFAGRASSELQRYDSEQKILESENQYQELIERSKNPIYILVGRKLELVNKAWLDMFGYTIEEVKSPDFSITQIIRPESHELIQTRMDNFLAGISQPFNYEIGAVSKSGQKYELEVSVTYLNWSGKRAVQGIYRNITEEKRREKQLQKELKESQELALIKKAFLANLSQEVQSNLIILNHKSTVLQKYIDPESPGIELAEGIKQASSDFLKYINDIMDMSRIEMGRIALNKERFHLHELLTEVLKYFKPLTDKKGIELSCCKKKHEKVIVEADPLRVRQILIKIISNAVKYTDKGKINITYEDRIDDVRVCVADTGIGIPPEKQKLLYKSFLEPNKTLSSSYDGTGVGLVLIKSLVHMMNGKIWLETNQGGGTKFYFTLPLA